MDKATSTTADQTHDFMNVDSFSQLPFIRPAPTTTKSSAATSTAAGIRLFGIDFSSSSTATDNSDDTTTTATATASATMTAATSGGGDNVESGRKFECHYCCRNFPTSQALGGHQNAHKRERQNAKRAHLHSAMIAADHHHIYNLVNYHNHHHQRSTNSYYPITNSTTTRYSYSPTTTATFSHHHRHQQPPTINGSPLAMWRIPTPHHHHHHGTFHRDHSFQSLPVFPGSSSSTAIIESSSQKISSTSQSQVGFDHNDQFKRRGTSEHVSLDLHL